MVAWNVWLRAAGGFISAVAQSVGTSDAVTVLPTSTRQDMRVWPGILLLAASSRVKIGSITYEKQRMIKGVELLPPHSHPATQPAPGPAGKVPPDWESLLH